MQRTNDDDSSDDESNDEEDIMIEDVDSDEKEILEEVPAEDCGNTVRTHSMHYNAGFFKY